MNSNFYEMYKPSHEVTVTFVEIRSESLMNFKNGDNLVVSNQLGTQKVIT